MTCITVNRQTREIKEYIYLGVKETVDPKGNIQHWHRIKKIGQGNYAEMSVKVGSKFTELYTL